MRRTCTWLVDYCQRMDISKSMVMGAPASKKMEWDLLQYMDFVGFVRFFFWGGNFCGQGCILSQSSWRYASMAAGDKQWRTYRWFNATAVLPRNLRLDPGTSKSPLGGDNDLVVTRNFTTCRPSCQMSGSEVKHIHIDIHSTFRWTWLGIPAANSLVPWPEQQCFVRMWWQKCSYTYTWWNHYPVHKDSRLCESNMYCSCSLLLSWRDHQTVDPYPTSNRQIQGSLRITKERPPGARGITFFAFQELE